MHPSPKTPLLAAILLAASASIAQEATPSADAALMARLSYNISGVAVELGNVRHVCIAVSRDGDYRIVRTLDYGRTQRLHGKMPKEEVRELNKLLEAADLRNLSGNGGGLIRQEAEIFAAEIAVGGRWHDDGHGTKWLEPESWRLRWLNADGEAPFPSPVAKVVDWLKGFEPKNAKRFENTELSDVCPSVGLSLVQPSISENLHP
jgi:hypothetical protein